MRRRSRTALAVAAGLAAALLPLHTASAAPRDATSDSGASVVSQTNVGGNLVDLTIDSPAMGGKDMKVRLIKPRNYQPATKKYPVLWLLHGCCESADYESWTKFTDAAQFLADKGVLVVMPTDGYSGFYTDWAMGSGQKWQTFHMVELQQILERGYGAGPKRAIAGISIGGYGSIAYAADYPGRFAYAASYSGIPDIQYPGVPRVVQGIMLRGFGNPIGPFGDPYLSFFRWRAENPVTKLSSLRGTKLYLSAGDGNGGGAFSFDLLEPVTKAVSQSFASAAQRAGLDVSTRWYGEGKHDWPYWERELHLTWPQIAASIGATP